MSAPGQTEEQKTDHDIQENLDLLANLDVAGAVDDWELFEHLDEVEEIEREEKEGDEE